MANFVGTGLGGAAQLTTTAGATVAQGTYFGPETTVGFAASAAVSSGDDGTLTHAWTVQEVPPGSSVVTGDITSPTSLTGATLAAFDWPGWYVLRLTTTRSSDSVVDVSDRHVFVGTADGGLVTAELDLTAVSDRDIKTGGDATYEYDDGAHPAVDLIWSNTAGAAGIDDNPNGNGIEIDTQANVATKLHAAWAELFPGRAYDPDEGFLVAMEFTGGFTTTDTERLYFRPFSNAADSLFLSSGVKRISGRHEEALESGIGNRNGPTLSSGEQNTQQYQAHILRNGGVSARHAYSTTLPAGLDLQSMPEDEWQPLDAVAPGGPLTFAPANLQMMQMLWTGGGSGTFILNRIVAIWYPGA